MATGALPDLRRAIEKDDDPDVRGSAVQGGFRYGAGKPALVRELRRYLNDSAWQVRQAAADGLADLGPLAKGATDALAERVAEDDDSDVRESAVKALIASEKDPSRLTQVSLERLRGGDVTKAIGAAAVLQTIPVANKDTDRVTDVLWRLMAQSENDRLLHEAFGAIHKIAANDNEVLAKLISAEPSSRRSKATSSFTRS